MFMRKIFIILLTTLLLSSCSAKESDEIRSIDDFDGKTIAFVMGTYQDELVKEMYPDIKFESTYLNTASELLLSLRTGKIDAVVNDNPIGRLMAASNDDLYAFDIPNTVYDSGFIFSDSREDLLKDFNEYLKEAKNSGYLESLETKWFDHPVDDNHTVIPEYAPKKGTIKVITNIDDPPFCFVRNNVYEGYDFDILYDFAYKYGYGLEIYGSSFEAVLAGVSTGKYDMGVDQINITEERKRSMKFSDPINQCNVGVVVLKNSDLETYTKASELDGKLMGCMSGSIFDGVIESNFDGSDIVYFNSRSELVAGLQTGKIEGYLADKPVAIALCSTNDSVKYIDESLMDVDYAFCFSKDALAIRDQFNSFLNKLKEDGRLEKLQTKWICDDVFNKQLDEYTFTGENGTLRVCTTPDAAPFSFVKDNEYTGYEVELISMFASEYGYDLDLSGTTFDAIISSIAYGKFDIAFNGIYVTEERKKSVNFSDPTYSSSVVTVVRNDNKESAGFIDNIKDKLYKTFVEEERYKLILDGIDTTLLISFFSLLFGTTIGFIIYLLSRKLGKWFSSIFDSLSYVITRLPVIVLLMVLFYVIFAKSDISGKVISIIGFTIIISNSVYGLLKTGVGAIDKGQFEGALALGYTDNQTLFKFVLPQALRIIMPSYRNEIISLIKSTSIVGYVTVQDLTRASDLIRSRTFDAFFPLIVTATIYFILASMLVKAVDYLQKRFLPNEKTSEEILKRIK